MPDTPGALAARITSLERRMDVLEAMGPKIDAVHRALLETPPGDDEPLIRKVRAVVDAAESGEWAVKWAVRIVLTLGGVAAALTALDIWKYLR